MNKVISVLLLYINWHKRVIVYLLGALIGKHMARSAYRKLQVDKLHIGEKREKLDYRTLLGDYFSKHNKQLKPVNHREKTKGCVPNTLACPRCKAPHQSFDDNTGEGPVQVQGVFCYFLILETIILNMPLSNVHIVLKVLMIPRCVRIFLYSSAGMIITLFIYAMSRQCLMRTDSVLRSSPSISSSIISTGSLILILSL